MRTHAETRTAALLLSVLGCLVSCKSPEQSYIEADRATYDAIGTKAPAWIEADAGLSELDKDALKLTVETWRIRLEAAEGGDG